MKNKLKAYQKQLIISLLAILPYFNTIAQENSSNIPEWFLKIENYNNTTSAIGISDPGLDKSIAFKQAKIRALLNYSILHTSTLKSLTTLSMGNQQNTSSQLDNIQYIIYTNIFIGKLHNSNNVNVVDSFYNSNKEAIVLVSIPENTIADSSQIKYTLTRRAAFQRDRSTLPIVVDELNFSITYNDSVVENYNIEKKGSKFVNPNQKAKKIMDEERIYRPYYYGISGITLGETPDNNSLPCILNYGLWNCYLFSKIDQICILNNFNQDLQYKLSTSNLGNISNASQNSTFQQLVYSLKNVQTSDLKFSIQKMGIRENQFYLDLSTQQKEESILNSMETLGKLEKKEIKKLKSENWQVYRKQDFESAWMEARSMIRNKDYINSTIEIQANNLQSGILEAINLAKLELSSQLGSKINTVNNLQNSSEEQINLNSSKLSNNEKTGKISPYFIFYKKYNESAYAVKVVLFYNLNK